MRIHVINADRGIAPDGSKGASIHLRSIIRALARDGHRVRLFSRRAPDLNAIEGCDLRCGDDPGRLVESVAADEGAPDLIYERYSLGHVGGLEAARRLGRPFALEVNSPLVEEATRFRPNTLSIGDTDVESRLWRESDLVFPVSTMLRALITDRRGAPRGVHLLRNGIDVDLFAEEAPPARDREEYRLAFLGHPKPWHGTEALPTLFADLVLRGFKVRLVVIGGGPGARLLEEEFTRRGLAAELEVTGPLTQREAIARLRSTDLALAPYAADPTFWYCPLKVLEAMAAGVPLVATSIGDIPEMGGDAIVTVPPGDREGFADAVAGLLRDRQARARMAEAGRARVFAQYTWDHVARKVIAAASAEIVARTRQRGALS